jgi:hypothetical protein
MCFCERKMAEFQKLRISLPNPLISKNMLCWLFCVRQKFIANTVYFWFNAHAPKFIPSGFLSFVTCHFIHFLSFWGLRRNSPSNHWSYGLSLIGNFCNVHWPTDLRGLECAGSLVSHIILAEACSYHKLKMCRWSVLAVRVRLDNSEQPLCSQNETELRNGIKSWKARLLSPAEQQEAIGDL